MDVETRAPTNPTTRSLKRAAPLFVAAGLLALYFAPQLPPVRSWLLAQVEGAARSAGYSLVYGSGGGNPWWGLHLGDAALSGAGLDLKADTLSVSYFLPALLTGKLPLSVSAEGVRGRVALRDLTAPGGSGRAAPVRPVLRSLSLKNVSVALTDVPYTLPDLSVTKLQARPVGDGRTFRAEAELATSEGAAEVNGTLSLDPLRFTADVPRLDARVARQWWQGVGGGTLAGTVSYQDGRLYANADLTDGRVTFLDETVSGLRGSLVYEDATVSANLKGTALGGAVAATGEVDLAARRWFAAADGALELRDVALWLAAGRLPVDLSDLPLRGSTRTQLSASGWRDVTLSGAATGAGSVAGYALDDLTVDYSFGSAEGTAVTAAGSLAGGAVRAVLTPRTDGFSLGLRSDGVQLSPGVTAAVTLALEQSPAGLSGSADAALTGTLLGTDLQLNLGGTLEPDVVRATVAGTALGSPVAGGVSFQNETVEARLELPSACLPGLKRPVGLLLQGDGPASALPLSFSLTTPEPTGLVLGPLVIPKDIGGQVSATLRGARLAGLSGRFGTLSVAGDLSLNAQGALTYSLNDTPVSGVVNGEASLSDGTLTLDGGTLAGRASVSSSALRLPGVTLPPLNGAELSFSHEETWNAALTVPDETLVLRYDGSEVRATTAGYPLTVVGQGVALSGTGGLSVQRPLDSLELAFAAATPLGIVTLSGGAAALRFGLEPALGPETRLAEARLAGSVDLLERRASLGGRLGGLAVAGTGAWDADRVAGRVSVQGGGERLELRLDGDPARPDLALAGRLPLDLVGSLFNVAASGTLDADLARGGDAGYRGGAGLSGVVASVPVELRLTAEGDDLAVTGSATPFALPVSVAGRLSPTLELNATSEAGTLTLDGGRLTGEGTVPGGAVAGFALAPQPWTLAGDLTGGALALPETGSQLRLERDAAGWRVDLDAAQTFARGDSTVSLDVAGGLTAAGSSLRGRVRVQTPAGDAALPFTLSPAELELAGELPAPVAARLFGVPLALNGDLAVKARARLSGGLDYAATAAWQTLDSTLTAQLEGEGANFTVTTTGDGLDLRYSPEALTVTAADFGLEPFLASVRGSVNGSLNRTAEGWDGALRLDTSAPVALTTLLSGTADGLTVNADAGATFWNARADGRLLPTLDLELGGAFRDLATLQGRVFGTLSRPEAAATLTTRPVSLGEAVSVPAQTAALSADLDGLSARLQGDALDLELSGGVVQGRLELPFTVQGEPQVLSADLGGTLTRPTLSGSLAGAVASGPVRFEAGRLTTTLQVDPAPFLDLPLAAPALTVRLEGAADLSWQAQLAGTATGLQLPLGVDGSLSGAGAAYAGDGALRVAGESLPLTVVGQGGAVQVAADLEGFDLASLAPALPLPLSGTLGGTLNLDTSAPQPLSFDLATAGEVRGRTFDLTASRADGAFSVAGEVAGTPLSLDALAPGEEAGAYRLKLGAADGPLELAGRLELAPALRFDATGRYLAQAVTATAAYTPSATDAATATWAAAVGDATLQGSAQRVGGAWTVRSTLESPADGVLPVAGRAEVRARVEDGAVTLDTLSANTALAGRAAVLELSGPAWPAPALSGNLDVAGFGRSDLAVATAGAENGAEDGTASGYSVALAYAGLELSATLSSGFAPRVVTLDGAGALPVGAGVTLSSGLRWTADRGFSGKAAAETAVGPFTASLSAVGTGPLGLAGRAVYHEDGQGQEVARLELALSDDPLARPGLSGQLDLTGNARLVPAYRTLTPVPTTLTGRLDVTGEVTRPRLAGPVVVQGALEAAGDLVWDGDTSRLALAGEGLDLTAEVAATGWTAAARAAALDLAALLPQLSAPRLEATVTGSGTWGEPPALQVDALRLQTPNGSVTGNLSYDRVLSGRLETDLGLSDLNLGPALQGRVAGTLALNNQSSGTPSPSGVEAGGPGLTGTLAATSLGLAGRTATLAGDLIVRGTLAAPDLSVNLRGSGTANGTLLARLAPSQDSYAVTSTLQVGDLSSDFAVTLGDADFVASGQVAYRDYALTVGRAPAAGGDSLSLTGRERLEGWHLDLVPAARLELRGPLAALNGALGGSVALSAGWPPGGAASLGGTLRDLKVGPLEVGDVKVSSSGRTLTLGGDSVAATVVLQDGVAWRVTRFGAALPGGLALEVTGRGSLTSAELDADLGGRLRGETFTLPAALTYRRGTVTVTSDAALLGGRFSLDARGSAANGWQGSLAAEAFSLSGVTARLAGDLRGPLAAPELAAALSLNPVAAPATVFDGTVAASTAALAVTGDLVSPVLEQPLQVAGTLSATPELTLTAGEDTLFLGTEDGLLTAAGALELAVGPVRATLSALPDPAAGTTPDPDVLALTLQVPGLALTGALPKVAPATLPAVLAEGLVLRGGGGSVLVKAGLNAEVRDLSLPTPAGSVSLTGTLAPGASRLSGRWQGDAAAAATLPWSAALTNLAFETTLADDVVSVSAAGDGSRLDARYSFATRDGTLDAALDLPTGRAQARLTYDGALGPNGSVSFTDFPLFSGPALGDARVDAALTLTPAALSGEADLALGDGNLDLSGSLGWASVVPSRYVPRGSAAQNLTASFENFDPKNVPWVARVLPFVDAPLTGEAALREGAVSGRLSAPVTVTGDVLPLTVTLGGALGRVEAEGELGRSTFALSRAGGTVAGLVRFVDFPLHQAVAAAAGPREVSASLSGALRFEVPGGVLAKSYVRFSSERFVLAEGGVVTEGDLSFELENGALSVERASFEGVGRWQASGVASRDLLNLRFDAQDADFGPLLRLVPPLAGLQVGAFGSLRLVTGGSLVNPVVRADSPELEIRLGGSAYRLNDTTLTVQDSDFVTSGRLDGVAPLTGSLAFDGGGQVELAAPRRFDLSLRFQGDPEVPVLGTLQNVAGTVSVRPGEPWRLATTGVLGNPFELAGTLSPLDLRLTGQALNLRAPRYFLASSVTDADLNFFRDDRFHLAGSLFVRQAALDLESRKAAPTDPQAPDAAVSNAAVDDAAVDSGALDSGALDSGALGDAASNNITNDAAETSAVPDSPVSNREVSSTETPGGRSPFLARLSFDDLSVKAPQQISFSENFGSGELGDVDLVLGGTAARPTLNGSVRGLRGTVRFAGRDFALNRALAAFEPAQGLYPTLDIAATTEFDKQQVLSGLADIDFVEPQGGTFDVTLSLTGGVAANPDGPNPVKVDVTPSLSSDAVIELSGAPGTRPLSEPELFSLLTLGRLESPEFAQGNVVGSLAQGALDTAVDFLILSELQRGLGDALGLDLLEIRTTPLGSLLTGDDDFGVSLRLGGYLSDEVFASYEIGSLNLDADVSLRNQFDVRYTLGALEFSLAGRLDLYRDASLEPLPEIGLNLGYAFSPLVRLETGLDLSTAKQGVRFGVSLRW